jgi:hypothetical protein
MNFTKEFKLFLKARYPVLYISTTEEERLEYTIKSSIKESNINRGIYTWDFIDGYLGNPSDNGFGARNPLQALELVEKLKKYYSKFKIKWSKIIGSRKETKK